MTGTPLNVVLQNPLDANSMIIRWDAPADLDIIGYNVYRGLTQYDNFSKLNDSPILVADYTDVAAVQKLRTDYWYKVTALNSLGEESAPTIPVVYRVKNSGPLQYVINEIMRRNQLLMNLNGEYAHLLVRKTAGARCPTFDDRRGQHASGLSCPTCYGTSFDGGYLIIPNVLMRIARTQSQINWEIQGRDVITTPRGWLLDLPIIHPNDIIVDHMNRRYEVTSVAPYTPAGGVISRQDIAITELEPSHPIYGFSVPAVQART